jgi:hypothetical protein
MFVGSVYWFLSNANDLSGCRVTIWDCESEEVVFDSENCDCYDIAVEVDSMGLGDYDLGSYDIWVGGDGKVHLEINISIEED